ncbi:MAG: DUF3108 domain-containing protein [Alphaproteobacteria bacterium]
MTMPFNGRCRTGGALARSAGAVLAVAGLLASLVAPHAAKADQHPAVTADYAVYTGGLHVIDSDIVLAMDDDEYDVRLGAALVGVPSWFSDWAAVIESDGRIAGDTLNPARSTVERMRRGEVRVTALRFDGDGEVDVTFDPERSDNDEPVPQDMLVGALDPLSGLVSIIHSMTAAGGCATTVPVYDGRRRYDLVFTDRGMEQLVGSDIATYAGPARRCHMQLVAVAGAFKRDDGRSFWRRGAEADRERQLDIWLARPMAGGPYLPVRIKGRTPFGAVVIHLRGVEETPIQAAGGTVVPTGDCVETC